MQTLAQIFNHAVDCIKAKDYQQAEAIYDRLIAESEDFWPAPFALGSLFAEMGMNGKAIVLLKRSLELNPQNDEAMANLAGVYRRLEKKDEAFAWNKKALAIRKTPTTLSNLAGAYINEGNPEPALQYAKEALALEPDMPQAGNHLSLALLELGRYEEGWKTYDSRLNLPQFHKRPFACPMWDGKPVKRLAIHGEQGLGDEILFLTCWNQLKHLVEEVEIEVNERLVRLIQNSFPEAQAYSEHDDRPFEPDAYIPMGSLPRLCWPVQPNTYLKPTLQWPAEAKPTLARRIGLSWKGGAVTTHARLRNAPVEAWKTFLELGDCISLQYGPREDEAKQLGIPHDSEAIADLDRLAGMIQSCDLVITVCNTTVHLAGALGVPCIVLVPSKPAWRYGLDGKKMIWYDSPVMVRQKPGEKWEDVFERAKETIAHHPAIQRA